MPNIIKKAVAVFFSLIIIMCSGCGGNKDSSSPKNEETTADYTKSYEREYPYNNDLDISKMDAVKEDGIRKYIYNVSMSDMKMKSSVNSLWMFMENESDGYCIRFYNGCYYAVKKVEGLSEKTDTYAFVFFNEDKNEVCNYRIEKLYRFEDLNIEVGKTETKDLQKYFPDYFSGSTDDGDDYDLQFIDKEVVLSFEEKDGKKVLSDISTPKYTFVISQYILPKDLELITK